VGSGAGFPGIPLAIAWPATRVVLLEARERKVGFLEQSVRALDLGNVVPIAGRLEDPALCGGLDPVHAVAVRAVGGLPGLLRHAARVARPGARWTYFAGSREAGDRILSTLPADFLPAAVREGPFGGALLVGAFHAVT
jgi:16S rRNA (guanine527-N7)-methyltransferase